MIKALENVESKTAAGFVASAAAVVLLWLFTEFTNIYMNLEIAGAIVVVVGWVGSYVFPSKTSVVSSGFQPRTIPMDPETRREVRLEVTAKPGSEHPLDPNTQLGHVNIAQALYVALFIVVVILIVILLRALI